MKINKSNIGIIIARYGVAIILIWIGIFKFTPTEAKDIVGVLETSPFLSWLYKILSLQAVSNIIGSIEIITGILFLISPFHSIVCKMAGILGMITFFITLTFLISAENMWPITDGLLLTNFFILKDLPMLGISIQMFFEKFGK